MLRKIILQAMFVLALITFAGALFLFGTTTVSAQASSPGAGDTHRPPPPPRIEALLNTLRLSAAQTTAVQNTLSTERTAIRALDESLRPQREAIHMKTRKELAAMLTPDQLQRYDEWRAAHRPPRPEHDAGRQGEAPSNDRRNSSR